jgi:hypothetical protein
MDASSPSAAVLLLAKVAMVAHQITIYKTKAHFTTLLYTIS